MNQDLVVFAEGKEQRTKNNYLNYGKKLDLFLQKERLQLRELKPVDAKKFILWAGTNKKGKLVMNTAAVYKQYLCSVVRFVDRKDIADYIRTNTREIKKEAKFKVDLKLDEVLKLIEVTDNIKLKLAWSLFSFDGLRAGEVLGLHYGDIDLEKKVILLLRREGEKHFPKGMKVNQQPKSIPLNGISAELFKRLPLSNGIILPISYKTLRKWFIRYAAQAGIANKTYPITMHKLRHFFAHYWRQHKGDIQVLKQVMRHSDIRYTMLYSEPTDKEIKSEFENVMKI
jgi:integrase